MHSILICDDERDIVSALEIYPEAEGYTTYKAKNGREALALLDREDIHLVLLDIMMPEMDGITALSTIRKHSNVPVILLTAKGEDADKSLGLNISADELTARFVRGDASRNTEGSGLGLSIARGLTELMGGKLSLSIDGDLFKATVEFETIE